MKILRNFALQVVAMWTILDNLVDGLAAWSNVFTERRTCLNFCAGFALISVAVGASILHTTQVVMGFCIALFEIRRCIGMPLSLVSVSQSVSKNLTLAITLQSINNSKSNFQIMLLKKHKHDDAKF